MRLKLTLAYNGSHFAGWQSQSHGNTVQDFLEKAFYSITKKDLIVHGAGRTDAGVHALAQCAHIDLESDHKKIKSPQKWLIALNAALPSSCRLLKIESVSQDFHARFTPHQKTYRYLLWNDEVLPPLLHQRVWHVYGPLDVGILKKLAATIVGAHDFRGFTARSGAARQNTVRTLDAVRVSQRGKEIRLTFQGSGFLYHMVRMLVGSMVHAARGKSSSDEFLNRLHSAARSKTPRTAPADGLYLVKVRYKRVS
ncbi:MAG: tRNA pseudouridine(38-40) synthase TruA [Chthoniobacterales bacterium]|nr:tRNA pseudouridine(38-40) synthase TruA [Chthoniobacterales bacterium]